MSFKNKIVIVTGGSSGIGAGIALQFVKEGAKVAIVGRNEGKLLKVAADCEKFGERPLAIVADITKDDDADRVVKETIEEYKYIDVLVNNAGLGREGSLLDGKVMEAFDVVIPTNLRAAVKLSSLSAPYLVKTKGNIINIGSILSERTMNYSSLYFCYSISKAGLDHFTRCAALELASVGVRVNSVNPGPVKTDACLNAGLNEEQSDHVWEEFKKRAALNKLATVEEIADHVIFLASDKARSVTGSIVVVDNGTLLKI